MDFLEQFVALTVATVKADREMEQKEVDTIVFLADGLKLDTEKVANIIKEIIIFKLIVSFFMFLV